VRCLFASFLFSLISPLLSPILSPILEGTALGACPPTVRLGGDASLVSEVTPVLEARGVSTDPGGCPAVAVTLERRGKATVVSRAAAEAPVAAREVSDVRTAATVIESWVRTDVEEPLLARRRLDDRERPDAAPEIVASRPTVAPRTLQLFALAETSFATDHTRWVGLQAGACTMIGSACLGGRVRFATVADGPGEWEAAMDREAVDALVDLDLPVRIGPVTAASGLGLGLGWTHTHEELSADGKQTFGLRAEMHLSLSYPLTRHLAAESMMSFALGQGVYTVTTTREALPGDPRLLAHAAFGLRFEGP
jgi:hypothetical protein